MERHFHFFSLMDVVGMEIGLVEQKRLVRRWEEILATIRLWLYDRKMSPALDHCSTTVVGVLVSEAIQSRKTERRCYQQTPQRWWRVVGVESHFVIWWDYCS